MKYLIKIELINFIFVYLYDLANNLGGQVRGYHFGQKITPGPKDQQAQTLA
jgi:hypothetical protein